MLETVNWRALLGTLRNRLLAGLLVSVPLIVSLIVLMVAFQFISNMSTPLLAAIGISEPIPGLPFVITLLLILGMGFMATNVLGARIISWFEGVMLRIPVVATIYSATKQVIDSVKAFRGTQSFQRVVWIPYPDFEGYRLLAFVTGQYFDDHLEREVTCVFLPTSPNPLTGFTLLIDSDKVTNCALSLEEASKLVVSAGLVSPKRPGTVTPEMMTPFPQVAPSPVEMETSSSESGAPKTADRDSYLPKN
ncbi:MAG: DUF502 domain-containing protein [Verrucomicrobiales bacterium]